MVLAFVLGLYLVLACAVIAVVVRKLERSERAQCDICEAYRTDEELEYIVRNGFMMQECAYCLLEKVANDA